jgi:hypothetical protein
MKKNSKFNPPKPKTQQNNSGAGEQKCSVTGDMHVRGEITVQPSPEEKLTRETTEGKHDAKDRKKLWLECASFGVLTIYASLTLWQSCSSQKIVNLTRTQFITDQRPYISSTNTLSEGPLPAPLKGMQVGIEYTNFGKSPALHVRSVDQVFGGLDQMTKVDSWFVGLGNGPLPKSYQGVELPETIAMQSEKKGSLVGGINDVSNPNDTYVAVMRIEYFDVSGSRYWTDICWMHIGNSQPPAFARCMTHNEIH